MNSAKQMRKAELMAPAQVVAKKRGGLSKRESIMLKVLQRIAPIIKNDVSKGRGVFSDEDMALVDDAISLALRK